MTTDNMTLTDRVSDDPATVHARCYINGRWADGGGELSERANPFNRTIASRVSFATIADAEKAVQAAVGARALWAATSTLARSHMLHRAGDLLHARRDEAAKLIVNEMGKTLSEALEEIDYAVDDLKMSGEDALRHLGQVSPGTSEPDTIAKRIITVNVPVGVAAILTPWNFPIAIPAELLGPALACGNTVVWKPSEVAPGSGHLLAEVLVEAGFPPGVVNVVHGGGDVGGYLVAHQGVDMVGFVGSTATGERISRAAGVKKLILELGGNGPIVVMEDADLDLAVQATVDGAYYCAGQVCTAAERVLVHTDVHDLYVEKLIAATKSVKVGDPLDASTTMGPMAVPGSFDKTRAHLADAEAKGASIVFGGGFDGLMHEPTILTGVTSDMEIAQDETFGPVVPILRFSSTEEALRLANETKFGLTGAVFTESMRTGWLMAEGIECGTVHVNGTTNHWELLAPFGGMKQSGIGRILGTASSASFTNQKQITFDITTR